ncbi:MAG: cellulase family glycosylhydrolase [Fibrobacteraceae bacterium]|nr:cellulase family glycosylhydrolase [Fibrobacteraceae bacterium]
MKKSTLLIASILSALTACSDDPSGYGKGTEPEAEEDVVVPVDYSLGRAMNKRLGKGMNLGNAWDSQKYTTTLDTYYGASITEGKHIPFYPYNNCTYTSPEIYNQMGKDYEPVAATGCIDALDNGWGNAIKDEYFTILKQAGFNSVRIPVRWQHNSDPVSHTVNPERLQGVKEDIQLAINAGLAVVVNFHHYDELNEAGKQYSTHPEVYNAEKTHFLGMWAQVAKEMDAFPDTSLVLEILNEPYMPSSEALNDLMTNAYSIIRAAAPNKTIMFESYHMSKFADIKALKLPQDGNIIYSGHYYEPYSFTHQGYGYSCNPNLNVSAISDFKSYFATIKKLYPDIDGTSTVPLNMGEFGVSALCGAKGPSDFIRAMWAKDVIESAKKYGVDSWHLWGFTGTGFDAYNTSTGTWLNGFLDAFGLQQ